MKMVKGNSDWILLKDKYVDDFLNSLFDSGYIYVLITYKIRWRNIPDMSHILNLMTNETVILKKKNLFHYELYANWLPFYHVEVEFIGF